MNQSSHEPRPETPTPTGGGGAPDQETAQGAEAVSPHRITLPQGGWSIIQPPWSHDLKSNARSPREGGRVGKGLAEAT